MIVLGVRGVALVLNRRGATRKRIRVKARAVAAAPRRKGEQLTIRLFHYNEYC